MTVVLDAGGLLAVERGDPDVVLVLERERRSGRFAGVQVGLITV